MPAVPQQPAESAKKPPSATQSTTNNNSTSNRPSTASKKQGGEQAKIRKADQIKQYFDRNSFQRILEDAINKVSVELPDDCYGAFINALSESLPPATISALSITESLDSRGNSAFEIAVDVLHRQTKLVSVIMNM